MPKSAANGRRFRAEFAKLLAQSKKKPAKKKS
jgi:hypothetical protein